jgi:hypothetical protein
MAQLNIDRTNDGLSIPGPVVVESNGVLQLSTDVELTGTTLTYNTNGTQRGGYLAQGQDPYMVDDNGDALAVRMNDGQVYTVRRVAEADGVWASKNRAPAPVDSLEKLALGGPYMAPGVYDNTDEEMYAALGDEDEVVHELVYASPSGTYVRSSAAWFRLDPDDDDTLDGLEAIDVTPEFLPIFDAAEVAQKPLARDEVLQYEATSTAELDEEEPVAEEV